MFKTVTTMALFAFTASTLADMTIVMKETSGSKGQYSSSSTIRVKDGTVLMSHDDDSSTLYRSSDNSWVQIDHDNRSYFVFDEEAAAQVGAVFNQQMSLLQEKLKDLPPEQREQIMARMPQLAGQGKTKTFKVNRSGKTDTVSGFKCEMVEIESSSGSGGTACVASAKDLGIDGADFRTVKSMMAMMRGFAERLGTNEMPDFGRFGGVPIRTIRYDNGEKELTVVDSINTDSINGEIFVIPDGYTQRKLGDAF